MFNAKNMAAVAKIGNPEIANRAASQSVSRNIDTIKRAPSPIPTVAIIHYLGLFNWIQTILSSAAGVAMGAAPDAIELF